MPSFEAIPTDSDTPDCPNSFGIPIVVLVSFALKTPEKQENPRRAILPELACKVFKLVATAHFSWIASNLPAEFTRTVVLSTWSLSANSGLFSKASTRLVTSPIGISIVVLSWLVTVTLPSVPFTALTLIS